jgi:hypothetical protein
MSLSKQFLASLQETTFAANSPIKFAFNFLAWGIISSASQGLVFSHRICKGTMGAKS